MKKIAAVLAMILLAGCSSSPSPPGLSIDSISIITEPNTNLNSGLCVDFVVAYDPKLLNKLQNMTSQQYFSSVDQLRRDHVSMMDVWRWELVPDQLLGNYEPVFYEKKAWGGLFFADYQTPGDHRVNVALASRICVVLGPEDIQAVTPEANQLQESQQIKVFPLDATVLLNTQTPNSGMSQGNYNQLKTEDGTINWVQPPSKKPQATPYEE